MRHAVGSRLPRILETLAAGGLLNYAASNQYRRVTVGDTVWLVSVVDGRLRLVGRIIVGEITDQDGATRALGTTKLWQAERYILPTPGPASPIANLDIHRLAPEIRFISSGSSDRLTAAQNGPVNAQQLQTMRVLSPESASLLGEIIETGE